MKPLATGLALFGVLLAGCLPNPAGRSTPPATQRWMFAGRLPSATLEFDGARMEVRGSIARVWTRSVPRGETEPSYEALEEFDCVRGKRRTLLESFRPSARRAPLPPNWDAPWKEGMYVPQGGPDNWWGRTLLYICRAAGMPELARDSVLPDSSAPWPSLTPRPTEPRPPTPGGEVIPLTDPRNPQYRPPPSNGRQQTKPHGGSAAGLR